MANHQDEEAWVIPLHGAIVPLPPTTSSAASPANPQSESFPKLSIIEDTQDDSKLLPDPEELPSDLGFHPRLRRSA